MPEPAPDEAPLRPRSRAELFTAFTWLALQGFGGVLAVVQRELVEKRRWLTRDQFVEDWAVAQIMPGPNVVNLALMIGGRHFGLPGALSALAGMLLAPLAVTGSPCRLTAVATALAPVRSSSDWTTPPSHRKELEAPNGLVLPKIKVP